MTSPSRTRTRTLALALALRTPALRTRLPTRPRCRSHSRLSNLQASAAATLPILRSQQVFKQSASLCPRPLRQLSIPVGSSTVRQKESEDDGRAGAGNCEGECELDVERANGRRLALKSKKMGDKVWECEGEGEMQGESESNGNLRGRPLIIGQVRVREGEGEQVRRARASAKMSLTTQALQSKGLHLARILGHDTVRAGVAAIISKGWSNRLSSELLYGNGIAIAYMERMDCSQR